MAKIAAAIYLAVTGIQNVIQSHNGSISASDLFGDQVFITIGISISATYGLYLVASLLFVGGYSIFSLNY